MSNCNDWLVKNRAFFKVLANEWSILVAVWLPKSMGILGTVTSLESAGCILIDSFTFTVIQWS